MTTANGTLRAATWHYDSAERVADGTIHAIGVALGLIGAVALLTITARATGPGALISAAVYSVGLLSMLALSAVYNVWPVSPVKWALRRFDHAAIYLMIGGTYTPFIVLAESGARRAALLCLVWATAAVGIVLKLKLPGRFDRAAIALYLLLGWSGVAAYRSFTVALSGASLVLIAAGGVLYTAGVVFHVWQSLRFHNAIWHGFVLSAACCHYSAILNALAFTHH